MFVSVYVSVIIMYTNRFEIQKTIPRCSFGIRMIFRPSPVAARYKMSVCSWSLALIVGSNPAGGLDVLSLVSVVCCQVVGSATS